MSDQGDATPNDFRKDPLPKLNPDLVRAIRTAEGGPTAIARRFGITQPHVSLIRSRKLWSWVSDDPNGPDIPPSRGKVLTEADVIAIRQSREPARVVAERFGISRHYARQLRRGEFWKNAGGPVGHRGGGRVPLTPQKTRVIRKELEDLARRYGVRLGTLRHISKLRSEAA